MMAIQPALAAPPRLTDRADRVLAMQVALDRAGYSPGEIDAHAGGNTARALRGYQAARRLAATGELNTETVDSLGQWFQTPLVDYTITAGDTAGPFVPAIPDDLMKQADMPALSYTSVLEMLGERFHSSPSLLTRINPQALFATGEVISVPNVEPFMLESRPGRGTSKAAVTVLVTEQAGALTVENDAGEVVFYAPVTIGSARDPLPLGEWKVTAVVQNPQFHYNPDLFWDADPTHAKAKIAPGPNNPAGVVWIDLTKKNYGLHGTPDPSRIGKTQSHGCVRLTNWDAARLAALVGPGVKVVFR
jgi:lipoprotein-anchoring transpeptidase ErfK/SrfK